uniref:Putative secreted protein n=1 Tax=Ixodes ricinus TaxID=34613 RepID=A0A6B0U2F2_IXORI
MDYTAPFCLVFWRLRMVLFPCKGADTPCSSHRREAASSTLSAAKPASVCFPPAGHVMSCILRPSRLGRLKGHSRSVLANLVVFRNSRARHAT